MTGIDIPWYAAPWVGPLATLVLAVVCWAGGAIWWDWYRDPLRKMPQQPGKAPENWTGQ